MTQNFEIKLVSWPQEDELERYSEYSGPFISVTMAVHWSTLIRRSSTTPMDFMFYEVYQNQDLVGVALLMRLKQLKAYRYLWTPVVDIIERFPLLKKCFPDQDIAFLEVPISNYSGLFTHDAISAEQREEIYQTFAHHLSKEYPLHALCIKEDRADPDNISDDNGNQFSFMPNTTLPLNYSSFDQFANSLTSKKRKKLRKDQKNAETAGVSISIHDAPSEIAEQLYALYQNTNEKKKGQDDFLPTPLAIEHDFFQMLDSANGLNAKAIVAKYEEEIIAYCLLMECDGILYFKSVGLDYHHSAKSNAYFNLFYKSIEYGIERGCKYIDYGVTSYYFKKRIGCEFHPTSYKVHFYSRFLTNFGGIFIKLIKKQFSSFKFI
ncbi:MAG: GNAT family N-acetyltransferase [Psychromonas sp.]|nr:GNAT family N-acetyltransferase [Psychromonas sp.]